MDTAQIAATLSARRALRKDRSVPYPNLLDQYGWYCANSNQTQPVGQKKPNAWGLHDIHGNVVEWCSDWYDADSHKPFQQTAAVDPVGPEQAEFRVVRGGSWFNVPQNGRSAFRYGHEPDDLFLDMGFRVALVQSGR
jgi:formylglycine-generating enzyme required for sulfatase activity